MRGILSFCDILGYQSFLENNSATESALKVLDIITNAPTIARDRLNTLWLSPATEGLGVHESFQHLVFSDTIVLMLPYPDDFDEKWRKNAINYISLLTGYLKCRMFIEGLPLRCVIHEGDYITKETCLAGMAIVEAYRLTESLDLSAVVYSQSLGKSMLKTIFSGKENTKSIVDKYFPEYLTPMKNSTETKLIHYNWIEFMDKIYKDECEKDVERFVLKSFWAHEKDCPISVDKKVKSTSKLIRKLLIACNENDQPVNKPV